ncbi:hypothetical protein K1719_001505 [Acacia pycnantha]|nr:hypothetical protein K1719_001505 [Acacia pycnantha]
MSQLHCLSSSSSLIAQYPIQLCPTHSFYPKKSLSSRPSSTSSGSNFSLTLPSSRTNPFSIKCCQSEHFEQQSFTRPIRNAKRNRCKSKLCLVVEKINLMLEIKAI